MMLVDVVIHEIEPAQMGKQILAAAPKPSFLISLHEKDRKQVDNTAQRASKKRMQYALLPAFARLEGSAILITLAVINCITA